MILDKIIQYKKEFVSERKKICSLSELRDIISRKHCAVRDFKNAILNAGTKPAVIAEIKKASPSKGLIRPEFKYMEFAESYQKNNAAAISVLTDEKFFQGSDQYLTEIRNSVNIPVLRKDFIIDDYQIFEARAIGADAILLIVKCLSKQQIEDYLDLSSFLGMHALVETHDEAEAEIALEAKSKIIGVNNRNLDTFEVDLNTTGKISGMIPDDVAFISESGIKSREDVEFLLSFDIDAILVGETFMRYDDPGSGIDMITRKQ